MANGKIIVDSAQISRELCDAIAPDRKLTDQELIALAQRQSRIDAGLRVMISVTTSLAALHSVLSDPTFFGLLSKLPGGVKSAINNVVGKLDPLFKGMLEFQDEQLAKKLYTMLDAGVDVAYSVVDLNAGSGKGTADSLALYAGIAKEGLPYVLVCVDIVKSCLSLLAGTPPTAAVLSDTSRTIYDALLQDLTTRAAEREAAYARNLEAGRLLLLSEATAVPTLN